MKSEQLKIKFVQCLQNKMSIETEVEKQAVDNVYDENVAKACKHQNSGIYIIFEREDCTQ